MMSELDRRRILRLPEVTAVTGLSRSAIYARMSRDEFPQAVQLGLRAVGWRACDVYQWVNDLPACRMRGNVS